MHSGYWIELLLPADSRYEYFAELLAASTLMVIPVVSLIPFFQRYFFSGDDRRFN